MSDYQQISINHQKYNYELDPDLIFNFDSHVIEYVYTDSNRTRETNDTITLEVLNSLNSRELHKIESVLCCKANQNPYLLIICSDDDLSNYMFSYNVKTKSLKPVEFSKPVKGEIAHADMTCSPFRVAYVDRINTIDTKPSFAMVIGTKEDDATLILLTLDPSEDIMRVELTESFKTKAKDKQNIGHVTAICILTADKGDKRMGHSDPQILLGFSQGAILIYRIRASVYSYKASRIRIPVDLSEFTEFPGYPITQLSCARSYNSLLMNVALAQEKPNEIKYQYRQSYIKVVETRGDFTGRQRAIINPPKHIQSSAKILETKLIPSTTTLADSTLQLSIIFQNGDKSYDLNIWEVSPTKISQSLVLAMDQQCCVDTMARSDTVKSLKLDSNGYLIRVPQKIADIILEENEDEDVDQTDTTNGTNYLIVDNTLVVDRDVQNVTSVEDEKETDKFENERDQDMVDENIKKDDLDDVSDNALTTEIDADIKDTPMMEETEDIKANACKRTCGHPTDVESPVKRQRTISVEDDDNQEISLDDSPHTFITSDDSDTNVSLSFDQVQDEQIQDTTTFTTTPTIIKLEERHHKSESTMVENAAVDDSNAIAAALVEDHVTIDHIDTAPDIQRSQLALDNSAEFPLSSRLIEQNIDNDDETSSDHIEENGIEENDDSMSDIIVEQPQEKHEDKPAELPQDNLNVAGISDDVQFTHEAHASSVDQIIVQEDTTMILFQSSQAQMQDGDDDDDYIDDNNPENHKEYDQASYLMEDESGPDYTEQTDDVNGMFNQVTYDAFVKEENTTMIISSSEDEWDDSQNEKQETLLDSNNSHRQNDEERYADLREGLYLEESDEVSFSDDLGKDPIEDKDLLNEEDSIKFVSGGELSDVSGFSSSSNTTQQTLTQQTQPNTNASIDYIPVSTVDLLKLLSNEQDAAGDLMDIDNYATPSCFLPQVTEPTEPEPQAAEVIDENELAYTDMLEHCFGSTSVDLDSISQSDIDRMGNYCWHASNIQLKLFMLKYCQLHQMHKEGFLIAKRLLRRDKKAMTKDEIEECIALKKSLRVDPSVKFGDLLDPFNDAARHKLVQQEHEFYRPQIPVDFYKSEQGQMYIDYYNTGKI